jgi:hypothetical protein
MVASVVADSEGALGRPLTASGGDGRARRRMGVTSSLEEASDHPPGAEATETDEATETGHDANLNS